MYKLVALFAVFAGAQSSVIDHGLWGQKLLGAVAQYSTVDVAGSNAAGHANLGLAGAKRDAQVSISTANTLAARADIASTNANWEVALLSSITAPRVVKATPVVGTWPDAVTNAAAHASATIRAAAVNTDAHVAVSTANTLAAPAEAARAAAASATADWAVARLSAITATRPVVATPAVGTWPDAVTNAAVHASATIRAAAVNRDAHVAVSTANTLAAPAEAARAAAASATADWAVARLSAITATRPVVATPAVGTWPDAVTNAAVHASAIIRAAAVNRDAHVAVSTANTLAAPAEAARAAVASATADWAVARLSSITAARPVVATPVVGAWAFPDVHTSPTLGVTAANRDALKEVSAANAMAARAEAFRAAYVANSAASVNLVMAKLAGTRIALATPNSVAAMPASSIEGSYSPIGAHGLVGAHDYPGHLW